ncbi:uncharacterized protein LOC129294168 [Prosopis cineraria]|uniref:uncharacterized protein LOC129294168 n=1 Tax=Prosopis cineraria TaxID=364024 RepID=UPI00240FFF39|nr:uncharacterized protein LOC129294168 [Prosopis cineraria]XP_054788321.1 uncharacterized protein LOC129294168 [Prosopis cineraria]XP_054788322.1 uncharacterized protein LOC129294168 [Prosopis cineraria]
MDSGNSGSISSSGDEEYDSRGDIVPPFLNPHPQFGSFSAVSHHHHHHHHQTHHPPMFDLSPNYLQSLSSQTQPNSNPGPFLNLDTGANSQDPRSEPNCAAPPVSSPSAAATKQSVLSTDPSLQLRSNARVSAPPANAVRNPKKRTRASRRAPTTVLTTDTSNFRAMVQEFTGIPAPPFSGTSYSRRLDLLSASSSLRSSTAASSPLDTTTTTSTAPFYPLRPSPAPHPNPNPLLLSSTSSSSSPSSMLMLHNHVADAIASTSTANNPSPSINYQTDAGVPYSHPQNMLTMQILPFQVPALHPLNSPALPAGFSAKAPPSSSIPSLEDQLGMSHAHFMSAHPRVSSSEAEDMPLSGSGDHDIGVHAAKDQPRFFHVTAPCKLNFAGTSPSTAFNPDKNLENNSARGEGNIDSWICSSD